MNSLGWMVSPPRAVIIVVPVLALAIGIAITVASNGAPTTVSLGSPAAQGDPPLAAIAANNGPAIATRSAAGVTVEFQSSKALDAKTVVVYYKTSTDVPADFAQMLGIPRIVNPDGSFVLPQAYGLLGESNGIPAEVPGLPAGSSGAVYQAADIQPGAIVRFGPFYRSSGEAFTLKTTGAALLAGESAIIGGEHFTVSAESTAGMTIIKFVNEADSPTVMATGPTSNVTVTFDGTPQDVVHGSSNFAKNASYDVVANQSSVTVGGEVSPTATVVLTTPSIGHVLHGDWEFPLN